MVLRWSRLTHAYARPDHASPLLDDAERPEALEHGGDGVDLLQQARADRPCDELGERGVELVAARGVDPLGDVVQPAVGDDHLDDAVVLGERACGLDVT